MSKPKMNYKAAKMLFQIGSDRKTIIRIVIVIFLSIITTLISPLASYLSKLVVDDLQSTFIQQTFYLQGHIMVLLSFIIAVAIISVLLNNIKDIENSYINHNTSKKIHQHIFAKLSRIKYEYFEESKTYDLIKRVCTNAPGVFSILGSFVTIAMSVISTISFGILLSSIEWYFIIIIVVPNLLFVFAESKNSLERYFLDINQTSDYRKLNYMHNLFREKSSSKEIRVFNLSDTLIKKYNNLREKLYKQGMRLLLKQSIISFLLLSLSKIGLFTCLFMANIKYLHGESTIGDVTLVISAGAAFSVSFSSIFTQLNAVAVKVIYLNDWAEFNSFKEEPQNSAIISHFDSICFEKVSYKYPNSSEYALKNISCDISKGMTIALVGENGSGKTTFTKLLLGLLIPLEGRITINNQPQNNLIHCFRKIVSYVPQNFGKYKLSLLDNMLIGNKSFNSDDFNPKFINFTSKLPNGTKTVLGNIFPNSVDLSGGEWQRVSLERAVSKKSAEVFIMDEPSAALDPMTESQLYKQLSDELKGKTVIITSHRLGACSLADIIFVFDKGQIIEQGTHDHLMSLRGKYFTMYSAQRSLYERND